MTLFYLNPGTSAQYPTRCGWSSVDPGGAYGTVFDSPTPTLFPLSGWEAAIVESYYDSSNGTFNVTVGAAAVVLAPPAVGGWTSSTAYTAGQVVIDVDGCFECIQANTGNDPASSPTYWAACTTFPALVWNDSTAYAPGNAVCASVGTPGAYECIQANTGVAPGATSAYWQYTGVIQVAPPLYSASVTYYADAIVTYGGLPYLCLTTTTGNAPPPLNESPSAYWTVYILSFGLGTNANVLEPVPPGYLQLQLASAYGLPVIDGGLTVLGSWVTGFGAQFYAANPLGATMTTETELGPGYVRYSWPAGIATGPTTPPGALFTASADYYAVHVT